MKILHVIPFYYLQFAAPYEYTQILAQLDHQVDVIALRRPNEASQEQVGRLTVSRIDLQPMKRLQGLSYWPLIQATLTQIGKVNYDITHVYAFRGCGLLPLLAKSRISKWILDIRTGNVKNSAILASIADLLTRVESKSYSAHIALDEQVGHKVLGSQASFKVVPVGADTDKFQPGDKKSLRAELNLPQEKQLAIYIGSLNVWRRPKTMLKAFAEAAIKRPHLDLIVLGDTEAMPALREFATELGIVSQVHLLGYKPYEDIPAYITAADIGFAYVPNTPQFRYQPPLKTAEFLACGIPVVATNTEGNEYFVQHETNGLLATDDERSLGEAIGRMADDGALYSQLQSQARPSVLPHDWKAIVQNRLLPFYEQILSHQSS